MWTSAIDDPVPRASVSRPVTRARCAKIAERVDVLFGVETPRDPRKIVLDRVPISRGEGKRVDAPCRQITLATCFYIVCRKDVLVVAFDLLHTQ